MFHLELLAKEMDYLYRVLCGNNYPDWFLKKRPNTRPQVDQPTIQETPKEVFISIPYIPVLSVEFRRIFKDTKVQIIFKDVTLKSLPMHPKDKIPSQLHQHVVYQWTCPEEACNSSYIGGSSRFLENRVKAHNTSTTNAI